MQTFKCTCYIVNYSLFILLFRKIFKARKYIYLYLYAYSSEQVRAQNLLIMLSIKLSSKKWTEIRTALKNNDWNVTNAYQEIVSKENMFGYAFFGWHTTPYQKQKLEHIWRGVLFIKLEEDENQPIWLKEQTKTYLKINK